NVYPLRVPPLRERNGDVTLLAGWFLHRAERQQGLRGVRLTPAAQQWLTRYDWPGNVRELEHAITRAVVKALAESHSRDRIVQLDRRRLGADPMLPTAEAVVDAGASELTEVSRSEALDQYPRELIPSRLAHYDNSFAAAARSLGVDRGNFYRQL